MKFNLFKKNVKNKVSPAKSVGEFYDNYFKNLRQYGRVMFSFFNFNA